MFSFIGTLNPGVSQWWTTWGWSRNRFVLWSVRPLTPNAKVTSYPMVVKLSEDQTFTYGLFIQNLGPDAVTFEALAQETVF